MAKAPFVIGVSWTPWPTSWNFQTCLGLLLYNLWIWGGGWVGNVVTPTWWFCVCVNLYVYVCNFRQIIIRFPMAFSNNFRIFYPSSFLHPRCWPHSPFFTQTSPPNFSVFQPKPLFLLCLSLGLLPFPLRLCLLLYVSGFFVCSRLYTHI